MSHPGNAVIADLAGIGAAVSVVGLFHQYAFHEWVGIIAGCMAITYYLYSFVKWVASHLDNSSGD